MQRDPPRKKQSGDMLVTSSIQMVYPVKRTRAGYSAFHGGNINNDGVTTNDVLMVKCTAKIGNAYWQSVEAVTTVKRHGRMLESRSNGASNANDGK